MALLHYIVNCSTLHANRRHCGTTVCKCETTALLFVVPAPPGLGWTNPVGYRVYRFCCGLLGFIAFFYYVYNDMTMMANEKVLRYI